MNPRAYGWKPSLPDFRDLRLTVPSADAALSLPPRIDLSAHCAAPFDQGELGSCTANAIGGAILWSLAAKNLLTSGYSPSRLFIYYNERSAEGTVKSDAGAAIRDGIKVVAKQGAANESLWPYDIKKFAIRPSKPVYADGLKHSVSLYMAVDQSAAGIKSCLATTAPVVFGFTVYESFESQEVASSGMVPLPKTHEQVLGGHAVLLIGYDDGKQFPDGSVGGFLVRNSWGSGWGLAGNFWMPYSYVLSRNLASDFWAIEAVKVS